MTEAVEAVGTRRDGRAPGPERGKRGHDTEGNRRCFPPSYGRGPAPGLLEAWSAGVGSRLRPGKPPHPSAHKPTPPLSAIQFIR